VSRRILARQSLDGSERFVPDNESAMIAGSYPHYSTNRKVYEGKFHLMPGCFPSVSVVYCPSSATASADVSPSDWGSNGVIRIEMDWTNGGSSDTTATEISLIGSGLDTNGNGQTGDEPEPTDRGSLFNVFTEASVGLIVPNKAFANVQQLGAWSDGTEITCRIYHRGGVRNVDTVIYERPREFAREHDETTWPLHVYSSGNDDIPTSYPSDYPIEERDDTSSPTDRRFGTRQIADVTDRQGDQLGPTLVWWTAYGDNVQSDMTSAATEFTPLTVSAGTSMINLHTDGGTYDDTRHGWSLGNYAREFDSGCEPALRDKDGSIPVFVHVRAWSQAGAGNDDSYVRIQASDDSYLDIPIPGQTAGAPVWYSAQGHLRCGVSPEDTSVAQMLAGADAGGDLLLYNVTIEWGGTAPA